MIVAGTLCAACALGRAGAGRLKREGDGMTPSGRLRPLAVLYRADRVCRPQTALPVGSIEPDMGWCDDPADRLYNRPVRLPYPGHHERLWRNDRLYDIVVVIDFNLTHPKRNAGSAIFLHIARPALAPTEGCIAVTERTMRRLLTRVDRDTIIDIR